MCGYIIIGYYRKSIYSIIIGNKKMQVEYYIITYRAENIIALNNLLRRGAQISQKTKQISFSLHWKLGEKHKGEIPKFTYSPELSLITFGPFCYLMFGFCEISYLNYLSLRKKYCTF